MTIKNMQLQLRVSERSLTQKMQQKKKKRKKKKKKKKKSIKDKRGNRPHPKTTFNRRSLPRIPGRFATRPPPCAIEHKRSSLVGRVYLVDWGPY